MDFPRRSADPQLSQWGYRCYDNELLSPQHPGDLFQGEMDPSSASSHPNLRPTPAEISSLGLNSWSP